MAKGTLPKLERGTPLAQAGGALAEAITKGSLDYVMQQIYDGWSRQFPPLLINGEVQASPYLIEVFADYVIARDSGCEDDEYYRVPFSINGDDYVFAPRDQWEKVELTYQPAQPEPAAAPALAPASVTTITPTDLMNTLMGESVAPVGTPVQATQASEPAKPVGTITPASAQRTLRERGMAPTKVASVPVVPVAPVPITSAPVTAIAPAPVAPPSTPRRKRIIERRVENGLFVLEEADDTGLRKLRVDRAMTANVVNGNSRRYPTNVIAEAVDELKKHLHESAGQGRLMQVLGEAEHPSDKGNRHSHDSCRECARAGKHARH